jgi:hypothetical protein
VRCELFTVEVAEPRTIRDHSRELMELGPCTAHPKRRMTRWRSPARFVRRHPRCVIAAIAVLTALVWLVALCPAIVLIDGVPHIALTSCTRSFARTCLDRGGSGSFTVICRYPDGSDPNAESIYVSFLQPTGVLVTSNRVQVLLGKSNTPVSDGGVRSFQADRGAIIDATFKDTFDSRTRHVVGFVRC